MTIENYLKNREIFESRFKPNWLGYCVIEEMAKGIKDFNLFFAIYGHDRDIYLSMAVSSIDKAKRYKVPYKNHHGSRLYIRNFERSLVDKYPDTVDKLQKAFERTNVNF